MLEITDLRIYPVKSLQGYSLTKARLGIRGLEFDRNWMIVDSNGKFVTQRQFPEMAAIKVELTDSELILKHSSTSPLNIKLSSSNQEQLNVTVWQDNCKAIDEGIEASNWLSKILITQDQEKLRLVRFAYDYKRPVDPEYLNKENAHTAFADGFPFLVTSEESLQQLNNELAKNTSKPVTMDRFRPNIVVRGGSAMQENSIDFLSDTNNIYSIALRKPCQRCKIITIDQQTAEIMEPKEPLKTLVQMNPFKHLKGAFFGQNGILLSGDKQLIRVGDKLNIKLKKQQTN